jgi:hypothetical protein
VNQAKPVPEWLLERYLLDELPRRERRQLEKELERNPARRAELEKLRVSDRQILSKYSPEQVIPEILKRAALVKPRPTAARRWRLAWIAAPALAFTVFLLVILPPLIQRRLPVSDGSRPGDYIGIKGGGRLSAPGLQLFRRRGGTDEILKNGDYVWAGDLLQVAYSAGDEIHGVILSIDGAGAVTLHFPEKADGDTTMRSGSGVFLPQAYELDQAPHFERFIFITAREPLSAAAILEKAGELAAHADQAMTGQLDLPEGFRQFSLLLRK